MREAAMQEHVGQKLVHAEVTGHEEVQTQQCVQVYPTTLHHQRSYISQDINDQQVLGHAWYIVHLFFYYLTNYYLLFFLCSN